VNAPQKDKDNNLYIMDGVVVFGAPYDCLLSILCKNGVQDVVEYETKFLARHVFLTSIQTWAVSFNNRWEG
jgi:hypothetical protein